jgi:hypothetical protein
MGSLSCIYKYNSLNVVFYGFQDVSQRYFTSLCFTFKLILMIFFQILHVPLNIFICMPLCIIVTYLCKHIFVFLNLSI